MPLEGAFVQGRPRLKGRIALRRLGVSGEVWFFIDTGADRTMLQPRDGLSLRVNYSGLLGSVRLLGVGVGGIAESFEEQAIISFRGLREVFVYRMNIIVAALRSGPALPSLLGRDVLNRWNMDYRPKEGRLQFEVVDADETIELA